MFKQSNEKGKKRLIYPAGTRTPNEGTKIPCVTNYTTR